MCVLVFSVGAINAQVITWTGATDTDFGTATNWDLGTIPNGSNDVVIATSANAPTLNATLSSLGNADDYVNHLTGASGTPLTVSVGLPVWSGGGNFFGGDLNIETGGSLNFRNSLYLGLTGNPSVINVNDGALNAKSFFLVSQNANCTININGGTVSSEAGTSSDRNKAITIGGYYGYGTINVNGGTLKSANPTTGLELDIRSDRTGAGHVTVDNGSIVLRNNQSALVPQWIIDGKLKAVAGKEIVVVVTPSVAEEEGYTTITASAIAAPKEVAYLTKTVSMAAGASTVDNDAIIRMLQADVNFNVTVIQDPTGSEDLSIYDLVIVQETFGSSDPIWDGLADVQNITVPTIFNKAYAWQANKNHISSAASLVTKSASLSISIPDPVRQADPLFSGIDFSGGNDIQLFNDLSTDDIGTAGGGTNGIHVLNDIEINDDPNAVGNSVGIGGGTLHATTADVTTPAAALVFNELRKGTQIGTDPADVLQAPVIAFGMSYGAIALGDGANMTSEALTIWRNAAYHLTGMMSPSTLYNNPALGVDDFADSASNVSTNVNAIGNRIYVSNVKSTSEINIYSITGALVKAFKTNEDTNFSFKSGLWIATVKTLEGQKSIKLLMK